MIGRQVRPAPKLKNRPRPNVQKKVVVVKQGTLTYMRADGGVCTSTAYPAGTAFVDPGQGHEHTAFNLGSNNLVLMATYFDVPAGGSPRIDVPVVPEPC